MPQPLYARQTRRRTYKTARTKPRPAGSHKSELLKCTCVFVTVYNCDYNTALNNSPIFPLMSIFHYLCLLAQYLLRFQASLRLV